tara:strand:- start:4142 stop:4552 length:411 start_codon:yes stop_codon:yes gene_type:complete
MKAKVFEKLIRKIVREEIDYALHREIKSLKEDLRDEVKPRIVEENNPTLKEKIMGKSPVKNHQPLNFTNNSTLNDLLNETAQGDTNLGGNRSPVSVDGDFSSIGGVPAEAAPKEVVDAVTRDYSGLMKAIDNRNNK